MLLLSDNDAMVKTAQCRLLPQLLRCFGDEASYVVSPTFTFWLKGQMSKGRYPAYVYKEIQKANPKQVGDNLLDEQMVARFTSPGIDAGEQLLFAAACDCDSALVFTGDKRAIGALHDCALKAGLLGQLESKVLCLEQAMLLMLRMHSFDSIRDAIQQALEGEIPVDSALRVCFGSGQSTTKENAISALQAYVDDLAQVAGDMLYRDD